MAEDAQVGAAGPGHAAAIHQGGMVEGVGEDRVAGPHQGRNQGGVGLVAGVEEQARGRAFPGGQGGLQFVVEGAGPPEQPGGPCPGAVRPGRGSGGLGQPRVPPEAQVIVGAHIHTGGRMDGPLPTQGPAVGGLLLESV